MLICFFGRNWKGYGENSEGSEETLCRRECSTQMCQLQQKGEDEKEGEKKNLFSPMFISPWVLRKKGKVSEKREESGEESLNTRK